MREDEGTCNSWELSYLICTENFKRSDKLGNKPVFYLIDLYREASASETKVVK